ncbi:hypothetical protein LCGC14_1600360 [marine sediment metagenome]|uniref:Uncharacterized protein n=1 Tax=marine sediment metagenome TaxID=412755 RepID=A0A0F9IXT8_9ZZZZ
MSDTRALQLAVRAIEGFRIKNADLERQLAEAQRLLRAASGWMPESNVPPAWNEPILKWREAVDRIIKEENDG